MNEIYIRKLFRDEFWEQVKNQTDFEMYMMLRHALAVKPEIRFGREFRLVNRIKSML